MNPTPRITTLRVFRFSRFATLTDLRKGEAHEEFLAQMMIIPAAKRN